MLTKSVSAMEIIPIAVEQLLKIISDCEVCDYGDMDFEVLPDSQDPPMFHVKHPKTNGMMARKVRYMPVYQLEISIREQ